VTESAGPRPTASGSRRAATNPHEADGPWLLAEHNRLARLLKAATPYLNSAPQEILDDLANVPPIDHIYSVADPPQHDRYRGMVNAILRMREVIVAAHPYFDAIAAPENMTAEIGAEAQESSAENAAQRLAKQVALDRILPYVVQLRESGKQCAAPVYWEDSSGKPHNGTMTFVNTGAEVLGITNGHVARDCLEAYRADPTCRVGFADFDPDRRLVDTTRDREEPDLATFLLSEVFVTSARGTAATTMSWPPHPIQVGELVLLGGFPAFYRRPGEGGEDFAFVSFIAKVESVSEVKFGLQLRLKHVLTTGPDDVPADFDPGGWSGGPVYRIVEGPVAHLELCGIIFEYHHGFELVYMHPLTPVSEHGKISRSR
jgi:hypothetical protein